MGHWSVLAVGQGFARPDGTASFELYSVVAAGDPDSALSTALYLATRHWPEIARGIQTSDGNAVVHAEEIDEVALVPGMEVDVVDVAWT